WGFERVLVRPVYGQHLKQILVTMGGLIIGEELIKVIWGPAQIPLPPPEALRGSIVFGDASVEKLRLVSVAVGAVVLVALLFTLNRTKIGLLIRAGVQDREMVESLGYRIRRLFVGVFVAGSALAGLGGCLWGMNQQIVVPQIGGQVNILIFIVIIMGGLGSTLGCFVGALLVGLMTNYVGFLAPTVTMFSSIGLMVAILLWRPQGLYPVTNR
ncbi:MAG: branched-chain amino acid ABC transporter permease, partial [Caldimonas sp.]